MRDRVPPLGFLSVAFVVLMATGVACAQVLGLERGSEATLGSGGATGGAGSRGGSTTEPEAPIPREAVRRCDNTRANPASPLGV